MKVTIVALLAALMGIAAASEKKVVCYVGTWATYRHSNGKYDVDNINPYLCTHLMYAFFGIEPSGQLKVLDPYLDLEENWGRGNIKKFNDLKSINPQLKTVAAVGGWNEGSHKFSEVAKSPEKRRVFIESARDFLIAHNFDGLDMDWEYPARRDGDPEVDRDNHVIFLRELKEELSKHGFLLSAAVSATENASSISYNIPEISKSLDFINVMCYDLHGSWENTIGINAPLYASSVDETPDQLELNVNASIQFWLQAGAPAEKIVLGVPLYGRTFTLASPANTSIGSANYGPGQPGKYTNEPGFTGYNEICEKLLQEQWTVVWDEDQQVPYMYKGNQWIGYENVRSIQLKAEYANKYNLGGVMVWSLETDDFRGICGKGTYPIMKKVNEIIRGFVQPEPEPTTPPRSSTSEDPNGSNRPTDPTTPAGPGSDFKCSHSGIFPDPENCSIFHVCDGEKDNVLNCPNGLLFDKIALTCNWPSLVDC